MRLLEKLFLTTMLKVVLLATAALVVLKSLVLPGASLEMFEEVSEEASEEGFVKVFESHPKSSPVLLQDLWATQMVGQVAL